MTIPAYINFTLLLLISGVHFYWIFGGTWGLRNAVPEQEGTRAFQPGRLLTLVAAVLFGMMAFFFVYKIDQLPAANSLVPTWVSQYGLWLLAGIFLLRAFGDFRYVGFSKKVRDTRFAELDTWFYSPLCLFLGVNTVLLIVFLG